MSCDHDYQYYLAANEAGWRCVNCDHKPGEPAGYSPQLDRERLYLKCHAVLSDLVMANVLHVSNGTHGDAIVSAVEHECQESGLYDQETIALCMTTPPRHRCRDHWDVENDSDIKGYQGQLFPEVPKCD